MLYEFYGTECLHCIEMKSFIECLKTEEGVVVESLEVWHNKENEKKMKELDKNFCGGVPFFINTNTGKWLCGQVSYEELKDWAKGK